jgi:hypothetical protein
MIFERWDLIPEQGRFVKQEEHRLNLQNPWQKWHQHFSRLLDKLTTWGNTVDLEKENKQYSNQLGGNGRWLNDESVSWGQWCSKKDNQMNKQTQIILGAMLVKDNPSSNWWAALHLKDIFISSSWFIISNMVTTFERRYRIVTFEWSWKDAPIKTDCGTICFETQRCTSPHEYGWWTSLIMQNHFFV